MAMPEEVSIWLPIVSAIGSLGIGAFVGAVVAHKLRERVDQRRAEEERDGLLRLVSIEISYNRRRSFVLVASPYSVMAEQINLLQTDAWPSTRVRLAQLMPPGDFGHLARYYELIQELRAFTTRHEHGGDVPSTERSEARIRSLQDDLEAQRQQVVETVEKYLGTDREGLRFIGRLPREKASPPAESPPETSGSSGANPAHPE
jgi:hypothetical protein